MAGIPLTLAIAISMTGACWIVVVLAHLFDPDAEIVLPLLVFGGLTGAVEWRLRRRK
jgi:hypothetical protein